MSEFSWPLQSAIFTHLLSGAAGHRVNIPEIDGPVAILDDIPSETNYPYIVIGEETSIDADTKNLAGAEHTITIHSWSQYSGQKEIKIMEAWLVDKLHEKSIPLPRATIVNMRREFYQVLVEVDGITRHGISRYRVTIFSSEVKP